MLFGGVPVEELLLAVDVVVGDDELAVRPKISSQSLLSDFHPFGIRHSPVFAALHLQQLQMAIDGLLNVVAFPLNPLISFG